MLDMGPLDPEGSREEQSRGRPRKVQSLEPAAVNLWIFTV